MKRSARLIVAVALLAGVVSCGSSTSPSSSTSTSSSTNSSGNGEASKSGKQVVRDAMQAALEARSVRESGRFGQTTFGVTLLKGDKGATGSVTSGGQKVEVMVVGYHAYMKAPAAYWVQQGRAGRTIAHLAADKWTRFSFRSRWFWPWQDLSGLTVLFRALRDSAGEMTNEGVTTYNGQSVVSIDDAVARDTLYVSATGTPYLIALIRKVGGSLTFDRWNDPVTLTAPPGAIDISRFGN